MKTDKNRTAGIFNRLKKHYPGVKKTALRFSNPLEILVATILSAQCTDKRVNLVTPLIFSKYKTAADYAKADIKEFEQEVRSTGFYHNKAKNIIEASKIIEKKYHGKVPGNMEDLISLPGVARKTANVVLGNAFGIVEGVVVDTHVKRLSYRLGFSDNESPEKIEQDLMKIIPMKDWFLAANLLIEHGRNICKALKPACDICFLFDVCPRKGVPGN